MNEPKVPVDRKKVMADNVHTNAMAQKSQENRESYLKSCEAHGGELAEVVREWRHKHDI